MIESMLGVIVVDVLSITRQNILRDLRRFINTGYFFYAFGLIYVNSLLPLAALGLLYF